VLNSAWGHGVSTIRVSGWGKVVPPAYAGGTDSKTAHLTGLFKISANARRRLASPGVFVT
jgi:hypothetical protein